MEENNVSKKLANNLFKMGAITQAELDPIVPAVGVNDLVVDITNEIVQLFNSAEAKIGEIKDTMAINGIKISPETLQLMNNIRISSRQLSLDSQALANVLKSGIL
jgi:hypothetical protein